MININVAAISIRKLTTLAPTQNFSKAGHGPPQMPTVSIKGLISGDVCPAIDSDNRFNMQTPN